MIAIFGIPISVVHGLVVELHTGVAVFAFLALLAMLIADVVNRGKAPSELVQVIRRDADAIAYLGAIAAVFFLILSGITGYLIEPYSTTASSPFLLNKSLTALGALYFWAAYAFIRYWAGPSLWRKSGLYALNFITAIIAILFTALAGSIGAELSPYGESVMDPLYKSLGINFKTLALTQNEVYLTAGVFVIIIDFKLDLNLALSESDERVVFDYKPAKVFVQFDGSSYACSSLPAPLKFRQVRQSSNFSRLAIRFRHSFSAFVIPIAFWPFVKLRTLPR